MDDLYNQLVAEKDDYEFERIVDNYLKDGILFLKTGYVCDTLGEDKIMGVIFEDLKKDVLVELEIYTRNYVVEASRRKAHLNTLEVKVLMVNTISISHL